MNEVLQFISGKKTYLVTAAAIAYLIACQFAGKPPSEEIMGIFGFLGLSFLRMGVTKTAKDIAAVHDHVEIIQATVQKDQ